MAEKLITTVIVSPDRELMQLINGCVRRLDRLAKKVERDRIRVERAVARLKRR